MLSLRIVGVFCLLIPVIAQAGEPILLYPDKPAQSGSTEKNYFSKVWRTQVVTNVSQPSLTAFLPDPQKANGTAVVIAPGGGFHALSIESEGNDVARWLNERGVTAFVLRYRLVPTGADGVTEMNNKPAEQRAQDMSAIVPLAAADGLAAMQLVRSQATKFAISAERVGFMGFSAGGAVTAAVAFNYDDSSRPAFVAPVYAATGWLGEKALPEDAPPAFIVAASDDQLGLAKDSVALYSQWLAAGKPVELHMYAQGGHGFGMRTQKLPSDTWVERFGDWLRTMELM